MIQETRPKAKPLAWRDTLRFRLSLAIGVAVLTGILFISTWMTLFTFSSMAAGTRERLGGMASVMATAAAPHVGANDAVSLQQSLTAIRDLPDVTYVTATDLNSRPLASMGQGTYLASEHADGTQATGLATLLSKTMWLRADIVSGGAQVGYLYMLADMSKQQSDFVRVLTLNTALAVAVALATALIVFRTIGTFTNPLSALTGLMARLATDGRYDRRADITQTGEVGVLADTFNTMIAQIERRDRDLNDYRSHLEDRVDVRTQELREAMAVAQKANSAKSDFLATMSHEIRTPLNGMMVMAEMLAMAPLPERQKHYADVINRSGRRLLAIINDVLDFSKIEAGHVELETIPFSIDTILADAGALFSERVREKNLTLLTCVEPSLASRFEGDPTRLGQIVTNLVNNAIKFTHEGGIIVGARLKPGSRSDRQRQSIEISVTDTGIGIATAKIATIFDAFAQAEQSTSRKYGGTGLGLAICRKLAEAMGGQIHVESTLGEGSTFTLTVELTVVDPAVQGPAFAGLDVTVLSARPFVEKNLASILSSHGAGLLGTKGTVSLHHTKPDCIFVDEGTMPEPAICERIRASMIPVIALRWSFGGGGLHRKSGLVADATLTLPLTREKLQVVADAARSGNWSGLSDTGAKADARGARLPDFSRLSVLAVDDGAVNREVVAEALHAFGIACDLAESGLQAVSMAAARDYDVIFMDCSMPGMDGFEAARIIRTDEAARGAPRSVIAALTAHVLGDKSERYREAGMDVWIPKPFALSDIQAFLETVAQGIHTQSGTWPQNTASRAPVAEQAPLLSDDTLAMFLSLGFASGNTMAETVFRLFATHGRESVESLALAVAAVSPDNNTVRELAHALKSMCGSAGAERARRQCETIERVASEGKPVAPEAVHRVARTIEATIDAMNTWLASREAA